MLFKAIMKGENATQLNNALNVSMEHSGNHDILPCLAINISFNGRPAWAVVYNWGMGGSDDYSRIRHYIIDDDTGQISYFETCG